MGELAERREIVTPARMDDVLETMRMFDEFKRNVLREDDFVEIPVSYTHLTLPTN